MSTLKQRMAENGFESNQSYEYVLKALNNTHTDGIPCLNVQGDGGRRKTAFASALANSIDNVEYLLYHDFTVEEEPAPAVVYTSEDDTDGKEEPPISALDRIMSDACAYSEGDRTILILDQLQAANFQDHIRLYQFLINREWAYNDVVFSANRRNLTVFIISEEDVYHSLQKHSFRVWVSRTSDRQVPYKATDFALDSEMQPIMDALESLFDTLGVTPTFSEYKKILLDIPRCVHTAEDLANTIFGWTEGIEYNDLNNDTASTIIRQQIMPAIEQYIGVEDVLELSSLPAPV